MTVYPSAGSGQVIGLTVVTLAYTPPAGMGNTGVSADGFDLRKRGATVAWDAGVFDGQHAITQTGFAQVRVETKYSGYRLFGLTTSDIGGGFCPTRYGLELVHGGTLEIYENCVRVAYPPALVYGAGDQLRIEADAGVVRYKRQVAGAGTWQVLYTSTLPVTAALYFNASLYTPGSTLKEIRFVIGSTAAPSVNRTYYTFGGARVAMRDGAGAALTYLHGDQLGSASLATSVTGTVVSQQRYAPYGEVRWASGSMPTDFTFTSQRAGPANYVGSLTDYVARFYSPALGRFVSADTIVPGTGKSQSYNRYMYVSGNPLSRIDPSGHDDDPIADFAALVVGALDGWAEANMLGLASATGVSQIYDANGRANDYYAAGRVLGNLVAVGQGLDEMVTGAGGFVGGVGLCPETVGGGCAVAIASGAITLHGASVTLSGLSSVGKNAPGLKLTRNRDSDFVDQALEDDFYNRVNNHLDDKHLSAARRELNGEVVRRKPDGTPFDHVDEVRNARRGLLNNLEWAKSKLGNRLTEAERAYYESYVSRISKFLDYTEQWVPLDK